DSMDRTFLTRSPPCFLASLTNAAFWAVLARESTMRMALAAPVCSRPSVSLAATTATTPSPSSLTPSNCPLSILQPNTAFLPVRFISELAKHGPVQMSQVRASTYWPDRPAALVGTASATRAIAANVSQRFMDETSYETRGIGLQSQRRASTP